MVLREGEIKGNGPKFQVCQLSETVAVSANETGRGACLEGGCIQIRIS